jgi:hypothetical protein
MRVAKIQGFVRPIELGDRVTLVGNKGDIGIGYVVDIHRGEYEVVTITAEVARVSKSQIVFTPSLAEIEFRKQLIRASYGDHTLRRALKLPMSDAVEGDRNAKRC